jgi:penicillin-binding protein 1A
VTVALDDERYNPQHHVPSKRFAVGDLIRVHAGEHGFAFDPGPQAALVAIDPRSGDVLAMVGGYDYHPGDFNRATRAERQPGSAFKPFVYGAALQSRRYTAATIVDDTPVVYKGWEPRNFDGKNRGPLRLRVGLTHSINTIAAKLIADIGVDTVRELAQGLGITSELGEDLSLALGSSAVKVIDMAAAFAGIAAGGRRLDPRLITRLGSETIERAEGEQVLSPEAAFVLTSMMQSVVQEGTGRRARRLQRPTAGKTGTTNEQKDAWFVGFTPQLAVAVWVGFDTPRTLGAKETGSRAALPIWLRFMERALRGQPKVSFRQPPGVVVEAIDPTTGLLAPAGATDALQEYFIAGTEPKEYAPSPDEVDPDTILMDTAVP